MVKSSINVCHQGCFSVSIPSARSMMLIIAFVFLSTAHSLSSPSAFAGRRLLKVKHDALDKLEGIALEPLSTKMEYKMKYLADLIGGSLEAYPRRLFVEVVQPGKVGSAEWFERNYEKGWHEFEMIKLEAVAREKRGGMVEWLEGNVREEEFVVVKVEALVVEEMVRGRVLRLVDYLFLECDYQWGRRAYWECVTLYGRLRD